MNKNIQLLHTLATGSGFEQIVQNVFRAANDGTLGNAISGFSLLEPCMQPSPCKEVGEESVLSHIARLFAYASLQTTLQGEERQLLLLAALMAHCKKPQVRNEWRGEVDFIDYHLLSADHCEKVGPAFGLTPEQIDALAWVVTELPASHTLIERVSVAVRLENYYRSSHFSILAALQQADARATWLNADGSEHLPVHGLAFQYDYGALDLKDTAAAPRRCLDQLLSEMQLPKGVDYSRVCEQLHVDSEGFSLTSVEAVRKWLEQTFGPLTASAA